MDGMLSQEEINALLGNMEGETTENDTPAEEVSTSAIMDGEHPLTDLECDALGEISNISMGTAATTLSILVNDRVTITTPHISFVNLDNLSEQYDAPCVFIYISYQAGLKGKNILILKEADVKVITDLMMGGDGTNTDQEITDLHLSAICEAMNQMMGSAATSMSSMINEKVDISPPVADLIDFTGAVEEELKDMEGQTFVQAAFRMEIGDLVDSKIMQLYPVDFAKLVYQRFSSSVEPETPQQPQAPTPAPPPEPIMQQPMNQQAPPPVQQPPTGQGMPPPQPAMGNISMYQAPPQDLNIQSAQFQSFAPNMNLTGIAPENIDLIMDVPLEVTVELGRTSKSIHDILDFSPGTIIELNKLAGEPIDVLVNGKFVAKGEVVVIEENFGIRVTEIIKD
ncbi:MAG: flagellar motor switch phosphatase FliY [Lachnoclostridium sp.]|jgi:flagellar motor switch protein FliN/FliY|nr:flagellar motor switch phosphatase FliY [Lachnoclostridium sp.]